MVVVPARQPCSLANLTLSPVRDLWIRLQIWRTWVWIPSELGALTKRPLGQVFLHKYYNQNEFPCSFFGSLSSPIFYIQHVGHPSQVFLVHITGPLSYLAKIYLYNIHLSTICITVFPRSSTSVQSNCFDIRRHLQYCTAFNFAMYCTVYNIFMIAICKTLYSV